MKYMAYLKEHYVWAGLFGWLLFSIEVFLLTVSGGGWLGIYVGLSLSAAFFAGTFLEYRQKKRYLAEMQALTDGLDKKYLLPEMLKPNGSQETRILHEIMRSVCTSMWQIMREPAENIRNMSRCGFMRSRCPLRLCA